MNTLDVDYRNVRFMKTETSLTTNSMNRSPLRRPFLLVSIVTALVAFPLLVTFAEPASITIDVLEVFDYPGVGNQTFANKINDAGEIVGSYEDSSGVTRGYFRTTDGHFSAPIVEPNDTGNFTSGLGINNSRIICGDYVGSDGNEHGYFLSGRAFTEYDVAGALATSVSGINDAGDFAGDYIPSGSIGLFQAFVSIGGSITPIDIPGATSSVANQLNASNQYVGEFFDRAFIVHGFYGDNNGTAHEIGSNAPAFEYDNWSLFSSPLQPQAQSAAVPEIDPGSAASAMALLGCGVVMWSGRRNRKRSASGIMA